jgi:hypothetical protein
MENETALLLPDVPAQVREAARQAGGGWLDEVVGSHAPPVPLRYIKGSWRLDENGELTGEYVANEDYGRPVPRKGCPFGYSSGG